MQQDRKGIFRGMCYAIYVATKQEKGGEMNRLPKKHTGKPRLYRG